MTNTTNAQSIKCGNCSTFAAPAYHSSVDAVRACFAAKYAPAAPVVAIPAPLEPKIIDTTPKTFGRWFAKCTQKGCKQTRVADSKFIFQCPAHKWVRKYAKQLVGQFSSAAKHKCDSRCMGAVGPTCVCACGGVNHGIDLMVKLHA